MVYKALCDPPPASYSHFTSTFFPLIVLKSHWPASSSANTSNLVLPLRFVLALPGTLFPSTHRVALCSGPKQDCILTETHGAEWGPFGKSVHSLGAHSSNLLFLVIVWNFRQVPAGWFFCSMWY